jgi:nucleoside-diphosphate-sugar epimerase
MAEIKLNKQHPLYQEDLKRILEIPEIEELKGKSFLITGATGLIGTCLIDALMRYNRQDADIHIYAIGRNWEKAQKRLGDYEHDVHFHFIEQDVRQPLPDNLNVDVIIPLASNTHPLAYSQFPVETIEINVKGAEHALNKAISCGATVLYPSSVEVYGNARGEDVFTEDYTGMLNLQNARSCYPESKRLSEALCFSYMAEHHVNVKIIRLSRVFGPTMLATDTKASSQFIIKALAGEDIVLKSRGEQFFSYTYVADAVKAMLHVLLHGELGVPYNISNADCNVKLKDFASACARWAGKDVVFDLPLEIEQKGYSVALHAILDNDRLLSIGYKAQYPFKDSIQRTLEIIFNSCKIYEADAI